MFFSLSNTLASFQGYIIKILIQKLDVFIIVYLHDILIYTNEVDLIDSVWYVVKELRKHLLYANLKKYRFYQDEM